MIAIEKRALKITFRVNKKEDEKIAERANKANMTVSEYLRYSALNKQIIVVEDARDLVEELRGIGKNLNQLTILCHQGKITCLDISETKKKVSELWQLLNLLIKKKG